MESLRELNQICQKKDYKTKGNWMVRSFLREAALPITWLLLHTSITANQVTLLSIGVGMGGVFALAFPGKGTFLTGVLLLQLWYLLDHVDGQIARYRKTTSLTGRFYDFMMHHLIHGILFFALGWYGYRVDNNVFWIYLGFVSSMTVMLFNLTHDAKYKTFFEVLVKAEKAEINGEKPSAENGSRPAEKAALIKQVFSVLHKSLEIHVVMNTLTACVLIELFCTPDLRLRLILILYYLIASLIVFSGKMTYIILKQKVDEEFQTVFKISECPRDISS